MALLVADASIIIAFLETRDPLHARALDAVAALRDHEFVLPTSAYAEVLVGPNRRGPRFVEQTEHLLSAFPVRLEPISPEIARRAAQLRSRHASLLLADALVLATGDTLDADLVLTGDRDWPRISKRVRVI